MKALHKLYIPLLSLVLLFAACDTEDELIEDRLENNPLPGENTLSGSPGTLNFNKYVALGNSLTAGLMDAALYDKGQANSFPNILAQHLQEVDGIEAGSFHQPDINSLNGYNISVNQSSGQILGRFLLDTSIPGPVPTIGEPITTYEGNREQLTNFGVPGARVTDAVTPGYAQFNPLFARFASSANASMLGDAVSAQGSFFTIWLGGNDVLGWASSGGSGADGEENPEAEQSSSGTLTSINSFTQAYSTAISGLLASNSEAKGVALTIPSVTLLPFFRAVTYDPIALNQANADALNAGYQDYNDGLDAAVALGEISAEEATLRKISFQPSSSPAETNPVVMYDEDLSEADISAAFGEEPGSRVLPKIRQTNASDLLVFNAALVLGTEVEGGLYGLQVPLEDQYVLTLNEQIILNTRIAVFNGTIAQIVANTGGKVALLDVNRIFADVAGLTAEQATQLGLSAEAVAAADGVPGIATGGIVLLPDFSPNGIISTDGIHPNPKGHALIANEIIKVLNQSFDADIPPIDITPFGTVEIAVN